MPCVAGGVRRRRLGRWGGTVHDPELARAEGESLEAFVDVGEAFFGDDGELLEGDDGLVVAEVGEVEYEGVDGLVEGFSLAQQEVLEVVELLLLEAGALQHLRDHRGHVLAQQLRIPLRHQQLRQLPLLLAQQVVLEAQVLDCVRDLVVEGFDFGLQGLEVLVDHLQQDGAFFLVGGGVVVGDVLDVLDGVAGVHLLALQVVLDAALRLADRTRRPARYAAPQLDRPQRVQPAQSVLLSLHHNYNIPPPAPPTHALLNHGQATVQLAFEQIHRQFRRPGFGQQNPTSLKERKVGVCRGVRVGVFLVGVAVKKLKECRVGLFNIYPLSTSMSRPAPKEFELRAINQPYRGQRPRTSSAAAIHFQQLKQIQQNEVAAERSRRSSRVSKGLPDSARPKKVHLDKPKDEKDLEERKANEKADQIQSMDEHKIPMEELVYRFGTSLETGMRTEAAVKRNLEEGDNKLPEKKKTPAWIRFVREITNWFAIMLWIGSILCIVTYIVQPFGNLPNLYLAFVLIIVILITGIITFSQQAQSEALMEGFKNMLPSVTKCLRDGKLTQLPAEKLVRGDIVEVISGEKVPADLRIISSIEMKVDNSPLTGEVEPLLRSPECTHPEEPFETKNIAFFGTLCKEGRGRGIVINIGSNTVMGQIADLAATGGNQRSPLRVELDRFVLIITVIAITLGVVFFLLALLVVKYSALQCIIFGIGILVANVPEGLLACITISLAITAKKLAEKQVLVKNLEAVETLGSTSCICSDKTGTLTQNKMTVENIWIDSQVLRAHSKEIKGPSFEYEYEVDDPSFKVLHHTAMICSEAKFDVSSEMLRDPAFRYANAPVMGDASETALVKFYQPIEEIGKTRELYKLGKCKDGSESKMPFNSTNKYALSIVRQPTADTHYYAYIKGAPEKVWKYCGRILNQGKFKEIDAEDRKNFDGVNLRFGKNGERVLGFAMLPLNKETYYEDFPFNTSSPDNFNFPMENFVFVGLISLMDPPKESVPFAIKKCQSAGIKVIMVTGDQPPTAAAIAKQIGIITLKTNEDLKEQGYDSNEALQKANAIVIHGDMIVKAFEDGEDQGQQTLEAWVRKPQIVFARTTPAQKLLIVKACQAIGNVVGVTGDGVNDSPAIKQGDIGISMGISGSDVTKDAADMILLNDDFSSIVDGVEEGRKIFDNLKKTIVYLLTSNMTEIWPFVALVILQIPLPLSNIFMLVICVGTDIYPALALAYEEAEVDIMTRKPRKPTDHLVTARLLTHAYGQMGEIATAGGFFTYFLVMELYGFPSDIVFRLLSVPAVTPANPATNVTDVNYNTWYTYTGANTSKTPVTVTSNPYGNPYIPTLASNASYNTDFPNWLSTINSQLDLRGYYLYNCGNAPYSINGYCQKFNWPSVALGTTSSISGHYVAFTTETIFYAQSAYFVTIVMVQWSNVFACKSRKISFAFSAFNKHMFGGIALETIIFIFLLYTPGVNNIFGGRPLPFFMLGIPGLTFSMTLLIWEETRKFLMNMNSNNGEPNWWQRHLMW